MNRIEEIYSWTVACFSGKSESSQHFQNLNIKRSIRSFYESDFFYEINHRRLLSGDDEAFDLTKKEREIALNNTNKHRTRPGITKTIAPKEIRRIRKKEKALLNIYILELHNEDYTIPESIPAFAISFPESNKPYEVEWVLNTVKAKEIYGERRIQEEDEEDGDE